MPSFRDIRHALAYAFTEDVFDEEEFILLYNLFTSKNREVRYWEHDRFDLDKWSTDECMTHFRFDKKAVFDLIDVLQVRQLHVIVPDFGKPNV